MGNLGGKNGSRKRGLEERKPEAAPKLGSQRNNPDSNQRGDRGHPNTKYTQILKNKLLTGDGDFRLMHRDH